MDSTVPTDDFLKEVFKDFQVYFVKSEKPMNLYLLDEGTLESLVEFMRGLSLTAVFVEHNYIDKNKIRINESHYLGLGLEILGGVQLDSHRFNRDLDSMDFSSPLELVVFTLYQGTAFGVRFRNNDLMGVLQITPEQRVAEFASARREKLKTQTTLSVKKEDPVFEKFSEVLVLDRLYREIKDNDERINYVIKIARRPGNDRFKKSIMKDDQSGFYLANIRKIIELTLNKMDVDRIEHKQLVFDD